MQSLKEYYENYEQNIKESNTTGEGPFDINYNDSGIMKVIKRFLNWFIGDTTKPYYNPYSTDYDKDKLDAGLDNLDDKEKIASIYLKDLTYEQMKEVLKKAATGVLMKTSNEMDDKSLKKKYLNYKFCSVVIDKLKGIVENNMPVAYFSYSIGEKDKLFNIHLIESVSEFERCIDVKKLLKLIKDKAKKEEAKKIRIRFTRLSSKGNWSYDTLYEHLAEKGVATRNNSEEKSDDERIYDL